MEPIQNILNNYDFGKWADSVDGFMTRYRLWPKGGSLWVAVSGGRDSTLLLCTMYFFFKRGRIKDLKILHFNHQTRSGCQNEENMVVKYSELLQLPIEIGYPLSNLGKSNIEHTAREERYAFFKKTIGLKDRVYLGHHLDDSLEWSLMARFKSGRLASQLGIPIINGAFARPFLCTTRTQIACMAKKIALDWSDDESNQNLRFERNFLRSRILPSVEQRFPKYLQHYVASSNELARKLGVWRGGNETLFEQRELPLGGVGLFNSRLENNFRGAEELIRGIVEKLSLKKRGCLTTQVNKMIKAAESGKQGPIYFSGSVRGYMAPGILFFVQDGELGAWEQYDRTIVRVLEKKALLGVTSFPNMGRDELIEHIYQMPFPPMGLGNIEGQWNPEGRHFLLPATSSLLKRRGWQLNSLIKMAKGMEKDGKKGRVLPLDLLAQMDDFYCTKSIPKAKIEGRS